jgi:hypothetical protein
MDAGIFTVHGRPGSMRDHLWNNGDSEPDRPVRIGDHNDRSAHNRNILLYILIRMTKTTKN